MLSRLMYPPIFRNLTHLTWYTAHPFPCRDPLIYAAGGHFLYAEGRFVYFCVRISSVAPVSSNSETRCAFLFAQ